MGNINADPNNQLQGLPNLNSLGMNQGSGSPEIGPYGTPVTFDQDRRGFTNADGGHDWLPGQGPGGNWNGDDQKTGLQPISPDPGSGDALGYPRGTPQYNQATQAHQAWIQQNRAQGRTLADLGMSPVKGGGLSNYMMFAGTPRGQATPGSPQPSTPITGGGGPNRLLMPSVTGQAPTEPQGAQKRQKAPMINGPTRAYQNPSLQNQIGRSGPLNAPQSQYGQVPGQMNYGGSPGGMASLFGQNQNQGQVRALGQNVNNPMRTTPINPNRVY